MFRVKYKVTKNYFSRGGWVSFLKFYRRAKTSFICNAFSWKISSLQLIFSTLVANWNVVICTVQRSRYVPRNSEIILILINCYFVLSLQNAVRFQNQEKESISPKFKMRLIDTYFSSVFEYFLKKKCGFSKTLNTANSCRIIYFSSKNQVSRSLKSICDALRETA